MPFPFLFRMSSLFFRFSHDFSINKK
jgi:hypothetical protein